MSEEEIYNDWDEDEMVEYDEDGYPVGQFEDCD